MTERFGAVTTRNRTLVVAGVLVAIIVVLWMLVILTAGKTASA